MRDKILLKLAAVHSGHPWKMLGIVLLLTLISGMLATRLTVTMRWSDLLPEKDPRTVEFNQIIEEFTSASNIVVVVQGKTERMKAFADALAPRLLSVIDTSMNAAAEKSILKLQKKYHKLSPDDSFQKTQILHEIQDQQAQIDFPVIQRVDYKLPIEFLKQHGLMLVKAEDIENNHIIFTNPNLPDFVRNVNDALEKEYVGNEESISTREKEDNAIAFLDGLQSFTSLMQDWIAGKESAEASVEKAVDYILTGEPYMLSYDKSALILVAVPNFSATQADRMVSGTDAVHSVLNETLSEFPDVQAGLTGMIPIGRDEMVYGMESANVTTIIAVIAILIMLMIAFRMWVAPLFAIINLLIGILWAIGITAATVGQMNIMTQMMAVILLGLGIDFSIHFISGFTERRAAGNTIEESMKLTFSKYGKGILTGAFTTSVAFLSLTISESRGMKEMGIVTGLGLLAVLLTTFLALPSFLVLRERRLDRKKVSHVQRDISFAFLGRTSAWMGQRFVFVLLSAIMLTVLMGWQATRITFDQNYMNMEPKGLPSVTLQDTITDKFDLSLDYALVLANSVDESRDLAKEYRKLGTAAMTDDIGLYLPSPEAQTERKPFIQRIHSEMQRNQVNQKLSQNDLEILSRGIQRLAWNIMEIQDMAFLGGQDRVDAKCRQLVGNPDDENSRNRILELYENLKQGGHSQQKAINRFQNIFAPMFKQKVLAMANPESVDMSMLPNSILDQFANKDRTRFLISVYPNASIWTNMAFLKNFVNDLESVNDRATGMAAIFQALIEIIGQDGRKALLLTVILVFVLLWLDFRRPDHALIAILPLAAGVLWMVGLMKLTGLQFTVINVMGLPMIVGIGIDDGVHIVHRWISEGKRDLLTVFSSTGKAIFLTTLTTMLAFGSLYFSVWRGFASLGSALFLGVGACFITTILFLSGILGWISKIVSKPKS